LLAQIERPTPRAKQTRRGSRAPFLFEAELRFDDPRTGPTQVIVHTRDRCETRISFLTDSHLSPGQLVELDFSNSPDVASPGRVPGRVRRCRQFYAGWFDCVMQIGVTARRPLTWWERTIHWVGELTGFGPDDRRGHGHRAASGALKRSGGRAA
jgi:hypothetical protein